MAGHDEAAPRGPVVVITKLRPPSNHRFTLDRVDLLSRLDRVAGRRLVLVACPAGFGKTTLLSTWTAARSRTAPVAWVSLDEGDNDPVVLWSHIIEAIRRISPAVGDWVNPESAGSAPLTTTVLPLLVNALTDHAPITLILDDYHRLTSPDSRNSVAWFLEHAPPTFGLLIATRSEPRLPLAALRSRGELAELRSDDLRFSVAEAETLLNDRLRLGCRNRTCAASSSGPRAGRPASIWQRCPWRESLTGTSSSSGSAPRTGTWWTCWSMRCSTHTSPTFKS